MLLTFIHVYGWGASQLEEDEGNEGLNNDDPSEFSHDPMVLIALRDCVSIGGWLDGRTSRNGLPSETSLTSQ